MAIKCSLIENNECLKCGGVHKEMVLIGAFVMCYSCWSSTFKKSMGFLTTSKLYTSTYKYWLNKHQNK